MKKIILITTFVLIGISLIGVWSITSTSNDYHAKISEMYSFAGEEYKEDTNGIERIYDSYLQKVIGEMMRPKSASINPSIFFKESLTEAGLGEGCSSLEYLKLFDSKVTEKAYEKSPLCCLPSIATDMLPMVYDKKNERSLVMCGMSSDAHVIAISRVDFNKLMNGTFRIDENIFDIAQEFKTISNKNLTK